MGRTSFLQEPKELVKAGEGRDAGGCWRERIAPELIVPGGSRLAASRRG